MSSLSLYLNSLRIGEEKEVTTPDQLSKTMIVKGVKDLGTLDII